MDILSTGSGCQYLVVFYVFPDRFKLGLNCPAPVPPPGCCCSRGTASWNMDARYSGFRLPSYPAAWLGLKLLSRQIWSWCVIIFGLLLHVYVEAENLWTMSKCCCLVCCGLLLILVIICALGWKLKFVLHKLFFCYFGRPPLTNHGLAGLLFLSQDCHCWRPIIDGKMVHHLLRNMNSRWSLLWVRSGSVGVFECSDGRL